MTKTESNAASLLKYMGEWRSVAANVAVCTGIALFLLSIGIGHTIWEDLVISYSIGFCIYFFISLFLFISRNQPTAFHGLAVILGIFLGTIAGAHIGFTLAGDGEFISFGNVVWRQAMVIGVTFGGIVSWFYFSFMRLSQVAERAKEAELKQAVYGRQLAQAELLTVS
ncbi:MAG: hypothetical protein HZB29_02760 [Nitrospinae bacterium]|nr:hypothetical protein [Nitrospinota bacterium]